MKKIFLILFGAMALCMTSCNGNCTAKGGDADSVAVDSTAIDSLQADSTNVVSLDSTVCND